MKTVFIDGINDDNRYQAAALDRKEDKAHELLNQEISTIPGAVIASGKYDNAITKVTEQA